MKIRHRIVRHPTDLAETQHNFGDITPNLILVFAALEHFQPDGVACRLSALFPDASIIGCSTLTFLGMLLTNLRMI